MKVGILEILSDSVQHNWIERLFNVGLARHYASITPQAVAVWCRQLGHEVHYATYYGQCDPKSLLPDSLDLVFISTYTHASALAYVLAKLYSKENTLTVIGGPHARSFPTDCLRFFDFVVQDCDKVLIDDILRGHFERKTLLTSGRTRQDFPSVEERMPEITRAHFTRGRPTTFSNIALLTSVGCPYRCDFCIDWDNPFVSFPSERLAADLRYVSEHFPGMLVSYHDPNFGVRFDQVLDIIESLPENGRNPYVMESSLSILKGPRLKRLQETNCVYAAPGVEGWADYSNKAGVGNTVGKVKLERVAAHFEELFAHVPGLQANFVFGTDMDEGDEPFELTKAFLRRLPFVWPALNILIPFGGTPMFEQHFAEGRILRSMPFSFYYSPHLVTQLKNYAPLEYYERLIEVYAMASSAVMLMRRISSVRQFRLKASFPLRTLAMRNHLSKLRRIRDQLKGDARFRAFHEGTRADLPEFYRQRYRERLGRYAGLITEAEMRPELELRAVPGGLPRVRSAASAEIPLSRDVVAEAPAAMKAIQKA